MKTIVLGTAHLKSTPGKCSPDGKFKEYEYSRRVCKEVKRQLENLGYFVIIDVEEDDLKMTQNQELRHRRDLVNSLHRKYKNCIYVSIHVNAAGADDKWHNATGWEAYTSPGRTKADELATCLYKAAEKNLKGKKLRTDWTDKDIDKEANFYILKQTICPAVLTENFFQDTKSDVEYLESEEGFNQIIKTHVEGIINFINNEKNKNS